MEQQIAKHLNWYYYGMMVLALIAATLLYYLIIKGIFTPIDEVSVLGLIIQYAVIFDALVTIPCGLWGFKKACTRLLSSADQDQPLTEEHYLRYQKYAIARILLVSNSMVVGIAAFYILGCYQPMLWVAAIGAVGWYFTKPAARKIQIELTRPQKTEETY